MGGEKIALSLPKGLTSGSVVAAGWATALLTIIGHAPTDQDLCFLSPRLPTKRSVMFDVGFHISPQQGINTRLIAAPWRFVGNSRFAHVSPKEIAQLL